MYVIGSLNNGQHGSRSTRLPSNLKISFIHIYARKRMFEIHTTLFPNNIVNFDLV